ncbi:cytochrome P450 [Suillus spraguei]|nr:cytochrome P450 [Suillus spraguei]
MTEMAYLPFQYAQEHMDSMVSDNLQRIEKLDQASKPISNDVLKKAAATAIVGSYETITSTLTTFALAMVLHSAVQGRAQAKIDFVVGGDRLPTFEDRASLPCVESIPRETLRWHPIGPLGNLPLPYFTFAEGDFAGASHSTLSDDTYDGYFIPKGATVICNIRGISRDERRYPEASSFIPERYVFGFGRRACPGRYTSDASLWSAIVTMLATVKFSAAKDDQGKVIEFTPQFTAGLTRCLMFLVSLHFPITNSFIGLAALYIPLQYLRTLSFPLVDAF